MAGITRNKQKKGYMPLSPESWKKGIKEMEKGTG